MPLNKSTTYHQSVQFFVHFFSKKIVFLLSKKKFFLKFFLLSFTSNLLSFTTFYSVLPRLVLSFTKYPPTSPADPLGVPVMGALKGGGKGSRKAPRAIKVQRSCLPYGTNMSHVVHSMHYLAICLPLACH